MTIGEVFSKDEIKEAVANAFAGKFSAMDRERGMDSEYWRMADIADAVQELIEYADLYGISIVLRNENKWRATK